MRIGEDFMKRISFLCLFIFFVGIFLPLVAWSSSASKTDSFMMALTGDSIITRKLSVYQEPEFLKMIELLRSADVAFTNLEVLFHDYETYPMHRGGGTYMRADPSLSKELFWAGIDMVSRANNHSGDYGVVGMRQTTEHVGAAGLVQAGVGESLEEAREAKFLDTAEARVALVSCASTFPDHARAGKSRGDIPARPGLNPLRVLKTYVVDRNKIEILRLILEELGMTPQKSEGVLNFFDSQFVEGEKPEVRIEFQKSDLEEIAAVVRNASRLADYTLVTLHIHDRDGNGEVPSKALVDLARGMIDAGADIFVGHGPHVLRGIEIYKGKPIFYSLGNFIFQNETLLRLPYENYEQFNLGDEAHVADFNDIRYDFDRRGFPSRPEVWESVIACPCWQGKQLIEIYLYPIALGFGKPRTVRGRPLFADLELGKKIIGDLQRLSAPLGTRIAFQDGIGVVILERRK